ncbi:hypothetical protein BP6252_14014 [Coleophoma cylindrospora]|uniref:Cupin type-1 domain-containing protein n=1 Tax=Coleophoma cylindrospora TaxID=1849047 RepID=A0A3D8Q4F8_9HELO|nr:hypothetical protein BP6252_14014 [Coleophoma cylindrospora]
MASATQLHLARKLVVSNLPLPANLASSSTAEPAVEVLEEHINPVSILDGQGARSSIFTHRAVPTSNAGSGKIELADVPGAGIVLPNGVNVYHFDMAPGYYCPIHRTTSTDYMTVLTGEVVLLTPGAAFDPATGTGEIVKTLCKPGDVVVQRGTLHGWVNSTPNWIRLQCVVLDTEPVTTNLEGSDAVHALPDVWDVKLA